MVMAWVLPSVDCKWNDMRTLANEGEKCHFRKMDFNHIKYTEFILRTQIAKWNISYTVLVVDSVFRIWICKSVFCISPLDFFCFDLTLSRLGWPPSVLERALICFAYCKLHTIVNFVIHLQSICYRLAWHKFLAALHSPAGHTIVWHPIGVGHAIGLHGPKSKVPLPRSFIRWPMEYKCQVSSTSAQRSQSLRVVKMLTPQDARTFHRFYKSSLERWL